MALKTATQLPDNLIPIIMIQLTLGGALCPFEPEKILESVRDLANKLLKWEDWEPRDLHASSQKIIPPRKYLDDDIPFAIGCDLIVDIPINPWGYADVYIDNRMGLTVNLPGTMNANQLEAAIPLASPTKQHKQANPPQENDRRWQIDSGGGIIRDKNHFWMVF